MGHNPIDDGGLVAREPLLQQSGVPVASRGRSWLELALRALAAWVNDLKRLLTTVINGDDPAACEAGTSPSQLPSRQGSRRVPRPAPGSSYAGAPGSSGSLIALKLRAVDAARVFSFEKSESRTARQT